MKNTHSCPKCGGTDITDVPGSLYYENDPQIRAGVLSAGVKMTRYVCCKCGYVEYWVDPDEFARDVKHYWNKKSQKDREL